MKKSIFIIDDDPDIVKACQYVLGEEGFLVTSSPSPSIALQKMRENPADLIILDLRLPDKDGLEVCKEIKADPKIRYIPVIILSAKSQISDVAVGLEVGAEDYIRKPFEPVELLARVKTALRRKEGATDQGVVAAGPLRLDYVRYEAWINETPLTLTPKEFELLGFFLQREGRVLTRAAISQHVWGTEYNPSSKTIEVHVDHLRKKLSLHGGWVKVLKGVGYRFEIDE